jgi:hypothetical protein
VSTFGRTSPSANCWSPTLSSSAFDASYNRRALFGALHGNEDATNAFLSAITGAIPLPDFMSTENLGRIMAAGESRGLSDESR